jgi:hypothetical protein
MTMLRLWLNSMSILAVFPALVQAHAIGGQCKVQNDKVLVEAYYSTDEPAVDARVTVLNQQGQEVTQGRTDANGSWSFPHPGPGKYQVRIDAGAGHRVNLDLILAENMAKTEANGSANPSRESFTGNPIFKVLIGLALIVVLALILWIIARCTTSRVPIQPVK